MSSRIDEVELETEYRQYEYLLQRSIETCMPTDADAAGDAWNTLMESCEERGMDWYPFILRSTAVAAAREYGRSVDEVLTDLQKWPRMEHSTSDPDCYGGACCR